MDMRLLAAGRRTWLAVIVLSAVLMSALPVGAQASETLRLMHCWGEHRAAWVEEMGEAFEQAHPGVSVEIQLVGCGATLRETFITSYLGGASPDVIMIHTLDIPSTVELGALTPVDPFLDRDGIPLSMWYPSEILASQWSGYHYGLPIRTGGDANTLMYYNKELFGAAGLDESRPPRTWADLDEVSRRLIQYDGDELSQAAVPLHGGDYSPLAWLGTGGASLLSEDGRHVRFGEQAAIETLVYAQDAFARHYRGGLAEFNAFTAAHGGVRSPFPSGRLAMQYNGSWEASYIQEANPALNFGIALRPSKEADGAPGTHAGTYVYAMPSDVRNPDMAWELVKWLTIREETAGMFMLRQGRPSPVIALNQNPAYLDANPDWLVIGEALSKAAPLRAFPFTSEVMGIFSTAFGQAVSGNQPPHSVLVEAAERAQVVVDTYWSTVE